MKATLNFICTTLLLLSTIPLTATIQYPDYLLIDKSRYELSSALMVKYWSENPGTKPDISGTSTALHRGSIASWQIDARKLYLKDLVIQDHSATYQVKWLSIMKATFGTEERIFAEWFTGCISYRNEAIPDGKTMLVCPCKPQWTIVFIRKGEVVSTILADENEFTQFSKQQFAGYRQTAIYKQKYESVVKELRSDNEEVTTEKVEDILRRCCDRLYMLEYNEDYEHH